MLKNVCSQHMIIKSFNGIYSVNLCKFINLKSLLVTEVNAPHQIESYFVKKQIKKMKEKLHRICYSHSLVCIHPLIQSNKITFLYKNKREIHQISGFFLNIEYN